MCLVFTLNMYLYMLYIYVYLFRFDSVLICIFKVVLHETPEAKIQQTNASQGNQPAAGFYV